MRVWGYNAAAAVVLYAVIAPMLLVPTVAFVYRRYGRLATLPFLAAAGGAFYVLVLVAVAILPLPVDQAAACARVNTGWHLEPLRAFTEAAASAGEVGLGSFLVSWTFLQLLMNVVLLVPVGVLVGWHARRSIWVAAAIGLLTSLAIETTQGTGIWGIYDCAYRYAEFDDLLTNTAGAAIGWVLGRILARRIPWPLRVGEAEPARTGAPAPVGAPTAWTAPPRLARRVLAVVLDGFGLLLTSLLVQIAALTSAVAVGWFQAGDDLDPVALLIAQAIIPVTIVFVIVPCVRIDRATPGQAAVLLAPVDAHGTRSPRARAVLRTAIRWWPVVAFIVIPSPVTALLVAGWIVIEVVTVAVRPDRRSLGDLSTGLHLGARPPTPRWWHRRPTTAHVTGPANRP